MSAEQAHLVIRAVDESLGEVRAHG
jgi:hypothetical protein